MLALIVLVTAKSGVANAQPAPLPVIPAQAQAPTGEPVPGPQGSRPVGVQVITPGRSSQPAAPAAEAPPPVPLRRQAAVVPHGVGKTAPLPVIDLSRPEMADVSLHVGESRLLSGLKASRVVIGSEAVATAAVLENREIVLFGNAPGTVTMQVWDTANRLRAYRLTVRPADMARLADEIRLLLGDVPHLRVMPVGDKIVIDGHNLGDENLFKIAALTKTYEQVVNLTEYQKDNGGWDRMVTMDVKIVEFRNKDKLRELGVQWDTQANGPSFGIAGDLKSSVQTGGGRFYVLPPSDANIDGADRLVRPVAPFRTYFGLLSILNSRINLMASDGDAVILAEPQLTSRSGRAAMMNVGGRYPLAVSNGLGDRNIIFERYGVQLKITPWAGKNGTINSSIRAEVSEPDGSVSIDGLPAFRERVVETVFNVQDGQTMVISGLLQRSKSTSVQKVPLLGDLPLIGGVFRSTRESETESEVAIFVTPTIFDADGDMNRRRVQEANERAGRYLGIPTKIGSDAPASATQPAPEPAYVP